jgi:hypothetical protein
MRKRRMSPFSIPNRVEVEPSDQTIRLFNKAKRSPSGKVRGKGHDILTSRFERELTLMETYSQKTGRLI